MLDRSTTAASLLRVVVGDHDRYENEGREQAGHVAVVNKHPAYDSDTTENDIAVLQLSSPITYGDCVQVLCDMGSVRGSREWSDRPEVHTRTKTNVGWRGLWRSEDPRICIRVNQNHSCLIVGSPDQVLHSSFCPKISHDAKSGRTTSRSSKRSQWHFSRFVCSRFVCRRKTPPRCRTVRRRVGVRRPRPETFRWQVIHE